MLILGVFISIKSLAGKDHLYFLPANRRSLIFVLITNFPTLFCGV